VGRDAQRLRVRPRGGREHRDPGVVLAHGSLEQGHGIHVASGDAVHPPSGGPPVHGELGAEEERCVGRPVDRRRRDGGVPHGLFTLGERPLEQLEPRLGLGMVAADVGHPLLDGYVPRAAETGWGPEHFTLTVRQGVL